jgi:hypothetical protein
MKRILAILMLLSIPAMARQRIQGFCEQGGQTINVLSYTSSTATPVMRSYAPGCSVKVYITGSSPLTLATIYSTSGGTSLSNPFTASVTGYWFFYSDNGHYDVQLSGGGIPTPFTLGDLEALDLSVSLPIVNTSGTLSCPTCMTLDTAQTVTVTGVKTFDAPIFIESNQITDTNAFSAWGGASLNDSTALGYVVVNVDHTWVNEDNEARGVSSVVRASRSTIDEQTYGWDQFGIAGVVQLQAMTMPSDPIYGSPYIRGQQKAVDSELYYSASPNVYTANIGMNYLADLATIGSGVTLNTWAGLIVGQPGGYGGGGGHVVNGYGVWIQNLLDSAAILNPANAAAIKIDGLGNFGRILWQGAEAYTPTYGTLEFSASTQVQTATGVGFKVGGSAANAGLAAGSYAVGGVTLINADHSISTDAYINTSTKYEISGVTVIDSSRNGSFAELTASAVTTLSGNLIIDVTGSTQCLHVNSLGVVSGTGSDCGSGGGGGGGNPFLGSVTANTSLTAVAGYYVGGTGIIQCDSTGCPTISIGNVYNVAAAGTISTVNGQHVSAGTGSNGGFWLGVGGAAQQIVDGSGNLTLLTVTGSGNQCLHAGPTGLVTGTGTECGSGGGGGSGAGVSYSFNPNTASTLTCTSVANSWFEANTTLTGPVTISSVTCPPASGGYVDLSFTFSQGSTVYAVTLPSPFDGGLWSLMPINSTMTCKGPYDGTNWSATCDSSSSQTILPGTVVFSARESIVQCAEFNALNQLVGTGTPCGTGGGGGTPGSPSGSLQYNNGGVFAGTADFSYATHTLTGGASAILDMHTAATSGVLLSGAFTTGVLKVTATTGALTSMALSGTGTKVATTTGTLTSGDCVSIDANGNFVDAAVVCGGGGGGGNPFAGSVTANTALTDQAGFYINTIGVIQYSASLGAVNIGNVFNVSPSGDIVTCTRTGTPPVCTSYPHHVDAGGYYVSGTQRIDVSGNGYFGTINGSSGTFTASVTANTTPVNFAGFYIQMPPVNPGGSPGAPAYIGNTGVIQYATGTPAVINIGHVQDITANGTIFTTGHLAATPATNIIPLVVTGSTGGTANLIEIHLPGGTNIWDVDYLGNVVNAGTLNVNDSTTLVALGFDHVPLTIQGYTGGSADLLDVYNQPSGTNEFYVTRNYAIVNTGYGFVVRTQTDANTSFGTSATANTIQSATVQSGTGASRSAFIIQANASGNPQAVLTVGTTNYTGVTGTSICTHFVGGICVSF